MTSEFGIAVHAMVFLHHKGDMVSSEVLAENICTNPARVRKVMAQLKRAGLVETHEGAVGGYRFEGSADTVTLCDIAQAVGAAFVSASWRSGDVDKPCLVASGMGALMDEVYTGLDALCKERLQSVTVAALEARLFDGKPLAGPCGRAKKEKAAAAHGGAKSKAPAGGFHSGVFFRGLPGKDFIEKQ